MKDSLPLYGHSKYTLWLHLKVDGKNSYDIFCQDLFPLSYSDEMANGVTLPMSFMGLHQQSHTHHCLHGVFCTNLLWGGFVPIRHLSWSGEGTKLHHQPEVQHSTLGQTEASVTLVHNTRPQKSQDLGTRGSCHFCSPYERETCRSESSDRAQFLAEMPLLQLTPHICVASLP